MHGGLAMSNDAESGFEQEGESHALEPFDPEQIKLSTKIVPMDTIIRRIRKGTVNLAPPFQRNEVWGAVQKSRLIESLMLKIPIPMFYVASDRKDHWDVVDGLQRLSTICEFLFGTSDRSQILSCREGDFSSGFRLTGLEFWGEEYNGSDFSGLPELLQGRILETEFTFTIIEPGTPEAVKRNIFKRINTGGLPLTAQEIRHALYHGPSTALLANLVSSKAYTRAVGATIDDKRMGGREMILRMLAFMLQPYDNYPSNGDMDDFLSNTMKCLNQGSSERPMPTPEQWKILFDAAMERAFRLFGRHAFRRSYGKARRTRINKSLFEVWGSLLARIDDSHFASMLARPDDFRQKFIAYVNRPDIDRAISQNSWDKSSVVLRFRLAEEIVESFR